jgi:hypothetical protein
MIYTATRSNNFDTVMACLLIAINRCIIEAGKQKALKTFLLNFNHVLQDINVVQLED